jgi:type II secretory ATPase GspE/PulE/Tfp pilus assembly ATPase PilB-like protein
MVSSATDRNQEEKITQERSRLIQVPYLDVRNLQIDTGSSILSRPEMEQLQIVPIAQNDYQIELGIIERTSKNNIEQLKQRFADKNLHFSLISYSGFREIVNLFKSLEIKQEEVQTSTLPIQDRINRATQKDLLNVIAQEAYNQNASDIHIEPGASNVLLRLRIDGVLHPLAELTMDQYQIFLSIIQTRAGIKWRADYPQTGRLSEPLVGSRDVTSEVDMRVETVPTLHGTDVVMRLFNLQVEYLELKNIGLSEKHFNVITNLIAHPHGMVLIVGPTGSGKTSTQYAIINYLNKPEVKIITLEDPIEYELPGVAQIPVKTADAESFMEKFRAVLREDPDIVMLGEIRDPDTAKTALQASLTGHLVLSTYHAASAAAALSRMMDMIGTNPLMASAIRFIVAQRLLRKLCPNCRQSYTPTVEEINKLNQYLSNLSEDIRPNVQNISLYKAVGCDQCKGIGYRGRIMVSEQLVMSPTLEKLLTGGGFDLTTQKIHDMAVSEGMITILQDALLKAIAGQTSLDEVYRVIE